MSNSCLFKFYLSIAFVSLEAFASVGNSPNILYFVVYDNTHFTSGIGWLHTNLTSRYNTYYRLPEDVRNWTAVAADFETGNVTFHDSTGHWIYLSDRFTEPNGKANSIVGGTSGRVDSMTIDWLTKNIYWVDEGYNWIKMASYTTSDVVIIDAGLERPSGIACHPLKRYLFWTELGNFLSPRIERSSLSGKNRISVVTGLNEPKSIAVDINVDRIYWIDNSASGDKIESADLDGLDRRLEMTYQFAVLESISIDEDYIYVSVITSSGNYINYYNKTTSTLVFSINLGTQRVRSLFVTGSNFQPNSFTSPCLTSTCDHFCVSEGDENHECLCREGNFALYPNGTCLVKNIGAIELPYVVVGRMDILSRFTPELVHYTLQDKQRFLNDILVSNGERFVTSVVVDVHSNVLFYVDDTQKSIVAGRIEFGEDLFKIRTGIGRIEGMAVDWLALKLYWVDYEEGRMLFSSYQGTNEVVLMHDIVYPRSIAVDPISRFIFWTERTSSPKLSRCNLGGTNRTTLMNTNLHNPAGIAIDHVHQRVYIVDESTTSIFAVNFDGTGQDIIGTTTFPANGVAIFQDFLYLAETSHSNHGLIEAIHKTTGEQEGVVNLNTSISAIVVVDESTQPLTISEPCDSSPCLNDGTCYSLSTSYDCLCLSEFTGERCETPVMSWTTEAVNPCSSSPCLNGGVCNIVGTSYSCSCTGTYTGTRCETDGTATTQTQGYSTKPLDKLTTETASTLYKTSGLTDLEKESEPQTYGILIGGVVGGGGAIVLVLVVIIIALSRNQTRSNQTPKTITDEPTTHLYDELVYKRNQEYETIMPAVNATYM